MQKQKGLVSIILIIIIVVLLVVAGFFAYQYYSTKTTIQPQVQSNQQNQNQQQTVNQQTNNTKPIDQTAGWKTYTNSQYNLSFEYQPDQTVNENELNSTYGGKETVLSTKYNGYYFDLFIEENKNKVSFNTFLKDETNQIGFTSYTNKTIGKLNGDLAEIVGNKGTLDILYASLDFYMIDSNNHLYRFRLDTNDEMNVTNSDRQLFNQILSTFKFTP